MWTSLNKFLSYKLKEVEFRLNRWKRSREISQAYGKNRNKKTIGIDGPTLIKAVKFGAVRALALLAVAGVVAGTIKAIPWFSEQSAKLANGTAEQRAVLAESSEVPDIGELEAVVPPEGYLPNAAEQSDESAAPPDNEPQTELAEASPQQPPPDGAPLVEIFKTGFPHDISKKFILSDKSAKVLYLFNSAQGGRWEIEKAFPMATGENHGPKRVEGDKKTPEGTYFIIGSKGKSELSVSPLYGPAAFVLNYPNAEDVEAGRTGHGIWIHGSERGNIPPLYTSGCMALSNPAILELSGILGTGAATPVIIVSGTEGKKHLTDINFKKLRNEKTDIENAHNNGQALFETVVTSWKSAWESKDIDTYSQFYSVNTFRDGVQKWDAFKERKQRTFQIYSTIEVDISNIVLTELTENSATVKFIQVYSTNLNRLENAKRLFFTKVQGEWKITRESTFPKEELFL